MHWQKKDGGIQLIHEPTYNDRKILSFKRNADWYKEYPNAEELSIFVAQEGMEINV